MIKINLLPTRIEDKTSSLKVQAVIAALVVVTVLGVCYWFYDGVNTQIAAVQQKTSSVEAETKRLQSIIGEIEQIKSRKADLEKKLSVIDTLEKDRLNTVRIMEAVSKATPEQLWLKSFELAGSNAKLQGLATDNQVIAKFIQQLAQTSGVSSVVLGETTRASDDGFDVVSFSLTFTIKKFNEANNGPSDKRKG